MKIKLQILLDKINKDFFEIIHTQMLLKALIVLLKVLKEEKIQVCGLQLKVLKTKKQIL